MCGLAGILSFDPARFPVAEGPLLTMRDAMAHRGPDGAGLWTDKDGRIGLAHRRLSIIDLSDAASQPMIDGEGRFTLVFNGEIYNHRELRSELIELGHTRWRTDHSDTEVILHAFRQWGIECLHRFRGMFAFALWDALEKELWLVRDRIGVKPLYYALDHRGVVFASEIKAILTESTRKRAVNEDAFFHFLSFITTPAPMTMFEGIEKLAAGTWMRITTEGRVSIRRWWDALDAAPLAQDSDQAYAEQVLEALRAAVQYRKVSDVPLGVFLSGGIDSTTNLALFSEDQRGPVRTFAIGYRDEHASVADELPHARFAAERFGAEHHELRLTQDDLLDFLPHMVYLQDEPIADPVCVPVYYVSKLARDHGVKVCQVGEGADELFWGYPGWRTLLRLERLNALPVPRLLKSLSLGGLNIAGRGERTYAELLRRAIAGQPLFWGGAEGFNETAKFTLLSPRLRQRYAGTSSWEVLAPLRRRFKEGAADTSELNWMTYLDLNLRLPELLLMRVDKMSMGVGLEARVPFLDHEVVELALSIPAAVKTRGGELKAILKKAIHGLVPKAVLERKKQGFAVPVNEWFLDRLGAEARQTLDRFCDEVDLLDRNAVHRLFDRGRGPQIWYLYNFALWWRCYVAG